MIATKPRNSGADQALARVLLDVRQRPVRELRGEKTGSKQDSGPGTEVDPSLRLPPGADGSAPDCRCSVYCRAAEAIAQIARYR